MKSRCEQVRANGSRKPSLPSDYWSRFLDVLSEPPTAIPYAVSLYVTAAYWFTASTSFANPAVTIAGGALAAFECHSTPSDARKEGRHPIQRRKGVMWSIVRKGLASGAAINPDTTETDVACCRQI